MPLDAYDLACQVPEDRQLESEFRHCFRPEASVGALALLGRLGVPAEAVTAACTRYGWPRRFVGLARIEVLRGGLWAPDEGGRAACILPALDDGALADLVAVLPDDRLRPLRRRGDAWCLGLDAFEAVCWEHHICIDDPSGIPPLGVFDDPLAWLGAGGDGICPLDWRLAALDLARLPRVHAAGTEAGALRTARRLEAAFARRTPAILLRRTA
jgi:hypothetical protein